jgi:hypothetical protein
MERLKGKKEKIKDLDEQRSPPNRTLKSTFHLFTKSPPSAQSTEIKVTKNPLFASGIMSPNLHTVDSKSPTQTSFVRQSKKNENGVKEKTKEKSTKTLDTNGYFFFDHFVHFELL